MKNKTTVIYLSVYVIKKRSEYRKMTSNQYIEQEMGCMVIQYVRLTLTVQEKITFRHSKSIFRHAFLDSAD